MDLSFVPQLQRNFVDEEGNPSKYFDLVRFVSSSITVVRDGDEACFSLDTIEENGMTPEPAHKGGNKIRTYDGQFPLLSVQLQSFGTDACVEILQDLSVVKIGKKLMCLQVLDLCFQRAEVFIRPISKHRNYKWSSQKNLEYKCMKDSTILSVDQNNQRWRWILNCPERSVSCSNRQDKLHGIDIFPAWLSFDCLKREKDSVVTSQKSMNFDDTDNEYKVISVDIFASLSIRNILPEDIEWEVSNEKLSGSSVERQIVDGSTLRRGYVEDQDESIIKSGNREEVLSCDLLSMSFKVRFRCKSVFKWTEWVSINSKAANAEDLNTGNLNSTVESNDGAY